MIYFTEILYRQKTEKTTKKLAGETSSLLKQIAYLEPEDPSEQVGGG